jgi:mannose-6-phosphate isomerase-like protein (cupin superfamily)
VVVDRSSKEIVWRPAAHERGERANEGTVVTRPERIDLAAAVRVNTFFRKVLQTGVRTQLVAMTIPTGTSIGEEKHDKVEQTFLFFTGRGEMVVEGQRIAVNPGQLVVVPPGTRHDVRATGRAPLKLATIYAPPNHLPGRVHRTREDAQADREDEAYGAQVERG